MFIIWKMSAIYILSGGEGSTQLRIGWSILIKRYHVLNYYFGNFREYIGHTWFEIFKIYSYEVISE